VSVVILSGRREDKMSLDESLINYVKQLSLQDQYNDPNSKFATIAVTVSTRRNNGVIKVNTKTLGTMFVTNSCFFISVFDGVLVKNKNDVGYDINTMFIAAAYPLEDWGKMVDTNIPSHRKCIQELSSLLGVTFLIHIGNIINFDPEIDINLSPGTQIWRVNPEPSVIIRPEDPQQELYSIRMVNNGRHFEFIITNDDKFVYTPVSISLEQAKQIQRIFI
jgi:hypothetical protein